MDKKELCKSGLIICIVGLAVVLFAPAFGSVWANFYLRGLQYGMMDTANFLYIKEMTARSWQIIGGIVGFLGGLEVVLTYIFCKDEEEKQEKPDNIEEN